MTLLAVGPSATSLAELTPDPSSLTWGLQDISSSDAGRTQGPGNPMQKMRTSSKRKLQLAWNLPDKYQAAHILQAFAAEYFWVRYFDVMDGCTEVREFYAGDMTAPFKWYELPGKGTRLTTVSFDIIER